MDKREERGVVLAAMTKISRNGQGWIVPSQTEPQMRYIVDQEQGTCTCPDHQKHGDEHGFKCKHRHAVEFTIRREQLADGSFVETKSVIFTEEKTYTQDWPAYNAAQACEKRRLQVLLADLCRNLPEPKREGKSGPKPHTVKDSIFSMCFKVFCGFSARRFSTDLDEAFERGHLSRKIPGMKVTAFMENPAYTPILMELVAKSAAPLAVVETNFAVDSTGFSTSRFDRWFDEKHGIPRRKCVWMKVHASVGTKTHCVTAVHVLDKDSGDSPQFGPLVRKTAETFKVEQVSADKAYYSYENYETVGELGGTAYIAFKANSTGGKGGLLGKMFSYFQFAREQFMACYHKRSNVESAFSACKRKFGDAVRSKSDTGMVNEILCKLICHNLSCLIHEQEELGIVPLFWQDEPKDACNVLPLTATHSA